LPITLIVKGPLAAPDVKASPKVPTMLPFCLRAKKFPFQPFEPESVILIVNANILEQPEPGQKVAKILDNSKVFPTLL
jgi:hypothetical protein